VGLIPTTTLAAAGTFVGEVKMLAPGTKTLSAQAVFVRAAGGTTTKVYVQTTFDGGATWVDIMCLAFATTTATEISSVRTDIAVAASYTPTDGTLTDDSIKDGLIGDRVRVKYVVAGTYSGASSIAVQAVAN
jgi:hypothetical protein